MRNSTLHVLDKTIWIEKIPTGRGLKVQRAFREGDFVVLHIKGNRVAVLRESNGINTGISYPLQPSGYRWQQSILGMLHKIGIASEKDIARETKRLLKKRAIERKQYDQESLNRMAKEYGFKAPKLKVKR